MPDFSKNILIAMYTITTNAAKNTAFFIIFFLKRYYFTKYALFIRRAEKRKVFHPGGQVDQAGKQPAPGKGKTPSSFLVVSRYLTETERT